MMKKAVLLLLICVSNGWLFANHWTPNDSDYEDNMTLTGIVQINGVEQQSTTLEVGAFCGEECRGSGYLTYFFPTQRYVIQLLIFGETGDQMTFKLYDSNSGQELSLASPDPVAFNANGYGSLSEPYVLDFTGTGNTPHWVPNESEYEDNMTLTGVIQINGVEQQSTTLEVGVFCGEECRGASIATYFFPTQRYVVQLLIFGESGDQLTFKLYDHALGQELDLTSPDAVTFVANGYGSLSNPYVLNFTGMATETYTLDITGYLNTGGYYLIAFPVEDVNPTDIQGMTSGNYDLYYFDESQNGAEWRNYKTNAFNLHSGKGYLYAHSTDITLTFSGTPYNGNGQVSLSFTDGDNPGWNLLGNPFMCNAKLVDANNEPLPYYRMNVAGNGFEAIAPGTSIAPMEGIFYKASGNGVVYFIRVD